ncbi:transferrin [Eupeodes corollae]|uniref:transferrin n=1 Tax=Eupeodes corollae TaxID=290404 RepID=UPI00249052C5|nr:transferrin [Eupeodes corollae]
MSFIVVHVKMKPIRFLFYLLVIVSLKVASSEKSWNDDGKIRVCIVEGRGNYRKTPLFCPTLEAQTNMECVVGLDRLDCVRRIHKGTAHFGVFSSEDLVAARWATVEILVTSELRFHDTPFEYEVVAVVDNEADIHSVYDLRQAKLCHPGHALEHHWTEVLANYFESLLVPKTCDPNLSLTEDRIRASSNYFGPSCKAGPWVPDPVQDRILKRKYPSLCQLCYDPYRCSVGDKHWGRRGVLYCLTSGGGDVAWARLDDVKSHFGFSGLQAQADPSEYSYLCPDGHLQPLNSSRPCVWVSKPWPVIAARRSHAAQVRELVNGLSHNDTKSWQNALLSLLESYHVNINQLDNTIPIDDYLDQATAFQSAYSFPECNPPRSIVFCTTSIIQHIKCSWLQEASQVYGIQPNIQCIRSDSLDTCLDDTMYQTADVVLVDHENRVRAQRDFKLKPLLFEFAEDMHERYATIAVIRNDSGFKKFEDLLGAKACLPSFEGAAHLSVLETISSINKQSIPISEYFSRKSCIWNPHLDNDCSQNYKGEEGALRCLKEGADVAFVSSLTFKTFSNGTMNSTWIKSNDRKAFKVLCPFGPNEKKSKFEYCYLHWTPRGNIMVHNATVTRRNEIYNSFREMDRLFGKFYKSQTTPFTMFGPFDKRNNVMFRDKTDGLRGATDLKGDRSVRLMEDIFENYIAKKYPTGGTRSLFSISWMIIIPLVISWFF